MKFLLLVALGVMAVQANRNVLDEFVAGNAQFSANVYKELLKTHSGNFMVCPLSAEVVLGLVTTGAGGNTASQLSSGLQLPNSKESIENIFSALIPKLKDNKEYTLHSANKVYVKSGLKLNDQFKSTAVKVFDSEVENIDFAKSTAVNDINKWVEDHTEKKIKNLLAADDVDKDTASVLINALFFQGQWQHKFKETSTKKKNFYLNKQNTAEVDMMKLTDNFNYYESPELNAKFLEMPYKGGDVSMTFVLPNDKDGLANLEGRIADIITAPQYSNQKVNVEIPKYRIETSINFASILRSLGITDAFEPIADFKGITDEKTYITKVVQKSYVEVDEQGTSAAAASAVITGLGSAGPSRQPVKEFIADHPFVCYIKSSNGVMFIGRYTGHN